jgi:hypothetical protein
MRAENNTKEPQRLARDFEIRDTQENVFRPVFVGPDNVFAYRPEVVRPNEDYPDPNSAAGERSPQGSLILFKIQRFSLDNRPLELIIRRPRVRRARLRGARHLAAARAAAARPWPPARPSRRLPLRRSAGTPDRQRGERYGA